MRTNILCILVLFAAIRATQTKLYILHNNLSIKASQTEQVHQYCDGHVTYATQISVTAAEKNLVMSDDTFEVRTKVDCSSNSYLTALSSQGSVKDFTWAMDHPGRLFRGRGLCVEIKCTNYFMACNAEYTLVVDCI